MRNYNYCCQLYLTVHERLPPACRLGSPYPVETKSVPWATLYHKKKDFTRKVKSYFSSITVTMAGITCFLRETQPATNTPS